MQDGADRRVGQNADAESEAFVRVERPETGIARIVLARPRARNALSLEMLRAISSEVAALGGDDDVKAIILAADGPVFSAGHDLRELTGHRGDADGGTAFYRLTMETCAAMMLAIVRCPKPVIAAVQGMATAAGCQLVATCDLAVAVEAAKFCTPGVNIGLFCSTPMVALSRNVPRKRAMEMLLLGELVDARDAAEYGLVNRVVAAEELEAAALDFARRIAEKSPVTVAIGKRAFYEQLETGLDEAYAHTADVMTRNMLEADAVEGIGAFLEKRHPVWGQSS